MKAKNTSGLFEASRQAPTELSKAAVLDFIKVIPTLPPPSNNWFQNFNLNSIIMTTTAITLITSAVIYFSSPNTPPETSSPELEAPTIPIEIVDSIKTTPKIQIKSVQLDTIKEEPVEIQTVTTIALSPAIEESIEPVEKVAIKQVTSISPTSKGPKHSSDKPTRFWSQNKEKIVTDNSVKLSTSQLRRLKRQLLSLLKKDNINRSGIASFSTLRYTTEYLQLDDTKLKGDMFTKYITVLKSFGITPGPDRRVVVNNDFIQVGDYTDDGFDGQALGKNMDIYFIEGEEKNGLFSKGSETKSFLNRDRADDTILKTEGKLKDSRINLSKVDRLLNSQSDSEPKDGNRFYDSGNQAISIYKKETEDIYVELNGKQIRSLKKELYRELQRDKLIKNRKADVRLLFSDNDIVVNGQVLAETLTFRYQRILNQYGVKAAKNRKILMSTDFIVVGDFVNGEFYGSLQGSLNSEDLSESVFEQDFAEFPVFGFDKAMSKN